MGLLLQPGGKLHPGSAQSPPAVGQEAWACHGAVQGHGEEPGQFVQTGNGSTEQTQLSRDTARVERETVSTNRAFMANRKASAVPQEGQG